jgi:lysine N6-hydroxylase
MTETTNQTTDGATPTAGAVPSYHTIGIGAGPMNLSLAALFEAVAPYQIALFDRHELPTWHPELLFPGVRMQTSWTKDLVALADPCHRLTFLNYLVSTGRIYGLLNAQYDLIPREEYAAYLLWASERIENVYYGTAIERVSFDDGFVVHTDGQRLATSDHLVLGLGTVPYVPPRFSEALGDDVFVPEQLGERLPHMSADTDAPVAVVGGGQTGAECVLSLLGGGFSRILWFGRRPWFQPMDDSPPANDHYRPAHMRFLQSLRRATRRNVVAGSVLTGDAITPGTLKTIYQANYDAMLRIGRFPLTMFPARDVVDVVPEPAGVRLSAVGVERPETYHVQYVVLATGRRLAPLPVDDALRDQFEYDETGEMVLESDFSVCWKHGDRHKIYAPHRARFSHGIAATNLTLLGVCSAIILNSLFERDLFTIRDDLISTVWSPD